MPRRRRRPPAELPEPEPREPRPWEHEARNVGRDIPLEPEPGPEQLPDIPEAALEDDEPRDDVPRVTAYQVEQLKVLVNQGL